MTERGRTNDERFKRYVMGSLLGSFFCRALDMLTNRTSRVIELYFMYSLINLTYSIIVYPLRSSLAIVIRFFLITAVLVVFSEEEFWLAAKKNSVAVSFFRWLAQ